MSQAQKALLEKPIPRKLNQSNDQLASTPSLS